MNKVCDENNITFIIGIYRDISYYKNPEETTIYENIIVLNFKTNLISHFIIKSHIENLKINEARVFWNDPHPSPDAIKHIAKEIVKEIESNFQL